MSITVTQNIESRYVPGKSAELHYTLRGAANEAAARDELTAVCPATFEGLIRKERQIEAVHVDSSNPDSNIWKATVVYGPTDPSDYTTTFDTTGGSQHITQSPYTVSKTPANAPNMKGAIGFDGQRVNGVDIVISGYTWSETHFKSTSYVTNTYRKNLANLTGKVNDAAFRGFDAGEVQYRGANGQLVIVEGVKQWQITYQFAASPNRTNMAVGDLTVASKLGWDYLWVLYGDAVDAQTLIQQPIAAYVERPYEFASFSALGIGTS